MSLEINYPFPDCSNCPLAQHVVHDTTNTHPVNGLQTELKEISLNCTENNGLTTMRGTRSDTNLANNEIISDQIHTWNLNTPSFCPQK
ncbi:hypothetical protein BH10PAT1_BH10PAT1_1440 [soil metagenome]